MTTIERDETDEWRAANPEAALAEAISVAIGCHGAEFESAAIVDPTLVHEVLASRFAVMAVMGAPARERTHFTRPCR